MVETVSLDEAFFDLTGSEEIFGPAEEIVAAIKQRVYEKTQLTCSVGLAPNRFLAKLASELKKPDGLMIITSEQVQGILDPLPVERIWGVGKVTERRLRSLGFSVIRDLRQAPLELLVREFGAAGRALSRLARGEDDTSVQPVHEAHSISREITLPEDLYETTEAEKLLRRLVQEVATELRRKKIVGKTIRIKVRFPNFETITRQVSIETATDSTLLIEGLALDLFRRRVYLGGRGMRLIGVGVSSLLSVASVRQLSLFEEDEASLDRILDRLSSQYGEGVVRRGGDPG